LRIAFNVARLPVIHGARFARRLHASPQLALLFLAMLVALLAAALAVMRR